MGVRARNRIDGLARLFVSRLSDAVYYQSSGCLPKKTWAQTTSIRITTLHAQVGVAAPLQARRTLSRLTTEYWMVTCSFPYIPNML